MLLTAVTPIIVPCDAPFRVLFSTQQCGEKEIRTLDPPTGGKIVFKTASMTYRTLSNFLYALTSPSPLPSPRVERDMSCVPRAIGRTFFFRFAVECIQPCL